MNLLILVFLPSVLTGILTGCFLLCRRFGMVWSWDFLLGVFSPHFNSFFPNCPSKTTPKSYLSNLIQHLMSSFSWVQIWLEERVYGSKPISVGSSQTNPELWDGNGISLDHPGSLTVLITPGAEFRLPEVGDDTQIVPNLRGFMGKGHREQRKHSLCLCPTPGGFQTTK